MTSLSAWLAVLIYPLVMSFGYLLDPQRYSFDFGKYPVNGYRTIRASKPEAMPSTFRAGKDQRGRWLTFVKFFVAMAILYLWASHHGAGFSSLKVWPINPWYVLGAGLLAGALLIVGRWEFEALFPRAKSKHADHALSRGPVGIWLLTFFVAGIIEEPWRALSLRALQNAGYQTVVSVFVTALAFLFAHLAGIPARLGGTKEEGLWEVLVGSVLAVLFLATGTVDVPYIASLLYNSAELWWIRQQVAAGLVADP